MSSHLDERKWDDLRRRAATEKDPFKLLLVFSEIAAAAREEQECVKQHLEPAIQNYREHNGKSLPKEAPEPAQIWDRRTNLDIIRRYETPAKSNSSSKGRSRSKTARFLKLADRALHNSTKDVDEVA